MNIPPHFDVDEPPTINEAPSALNVIEPISQFNDILRIPQTSSKRKKLVLNLLLIIANLKILLQIYMLKHKLESIGVKKHAIIQKRQNKQSLQEKKRL